MALHIKDSEIKKCIDSLYPDVIKIRRRIHQNPELSGHEFKTASLVAKTLKLHRFSPVFHLGKTAVINNIPNGSGKSVILRADMDALPIEEKTGLNYRSKNQGIMHACGHDMHTAILIGTAKLLQTLSHRWSGTVYCLFQPAEEIEPGGASQIISTGALPKADSIFGLHVNTDQVTGTVGVKEGLDFSGITSFDIIINGKGGHGATPEVTIDPVVCASSIILQLQTLISREKSPFTPATLTIGEVKAGSIRNIIPDQAVLKATLRCHSSALMESIKKRITEMVTLTSAAFQTKAEVVYYKPFPPTDNDKTISERFKLTFESFAGKNSVVNRINPSMYAEDFAFYQQKMKGIYIHLGVRPSKGTFNGCGLHSSQFIPDEEAIRTGILSHFSFVISELGNQNR